MVVVHENVKPDALQEPAVSCWAAVMFVHVIGVMISQRDELTEQWASADFDMSIASFLMWSEEFTEMSVGLFDCLSSSEPFCISDSVSSPPHG